MVGIKYILGATEFIVRLSLYGPDTSTLTQTDIHSLCVYINPMPPFDRGMWMRDALDLQVERRVVEESSSVQQDRSYLLRNRLHQASCDSPATRALECLHPFGGGYSALSIPWG